MRESNDTVKFDRSSKFYSAFLLVVTALIAILLSLGDNVNRRVVGGILIGAFVIYLACIFYAIRQGLIQAPELSDSDESNSSDDEDGHASPIAERERQPTEEDGLLTYGPEQTGTLSNDDEQLEQTSTIAYNQVESGLFRDSRASSPSHASSGMSRHSLLYHFFYLLLGFAALTLSAYVISSATATLTTEFGISDVLSGIVILSIATTIPEKFVAAVSSSRGHTGIMIANTVGSNIFLLTLCMGILFTAIGDGSHQDKLMRSELIVMTCSSALMTATVWLGIRWARWTGAVLLASYVVFLVLEFTIIRSV